MRRALTWLGLLAFFLTLGFALQKNTNLRLVRSEVARLERALAEEHARMNVLRADYTNLTRMTRLEQLAARYLQELRTPDPNQVRVLEAEDEAEELLRTLAPAPRQKQVLNYERLE